MAHFEFFEISPQAAAERTRLRAGIAAHSLWLAGAKLVLLTAKTNFNPAQPRDPAGCPTGGRWCGSNGIGLVNLAQHEGRPAGIGVAHAIRDHVGKSDNYLINVIKANQWDFGAFQTWRSAEGSFASLESANKLVSATISQNIDLVKQVQDGEVRGAQFDGAFGTPTGKEAFATSARSTVRIRPTYQVKVIIIHSPNMPQKFLVYTAFPHN
jgi:hypothetical protein